jgi:opacity protein-like surface antigen
MKKLLFLVAILGVASLPFSNAFAAGPVSVGVEAGFVNTEVDEFDNTWMAGVFVDLGLPMLNWYLEPFINYWSWSDSYVVSSETMDATFSDWTIGGNVKMAIPTATMLRPFVGAGVSAHVLSSELDMGSIGTIDASDTKLGFQLGGGLNIDAGDNWGFVAQSWYHMVEDFNQWSVRGGVAWSL